MTSCKKFLKKQDLFGEVVLLNFQGKDRINSSIGGFSTILYYLSIVILIIYSSYFYSTNNPPTWSMINKFRNNNTLEIIPAKTLFFANNFMNAKSSQPMSYRTNPIDLKFETITSQIIDIDGMPKNTITTTKLGDFERCQVIKNDTEIDSKDFDLFIQRFSESALCFDFKNNLIIGGDIYTNSFSQKGKLSFSLNICDIIGIKNCSSKNIIEANRNNKAFKLRYFFNNYYSNIFSEKGYSNFFQTGELDIDLFYNYDIKLIFQKNLISTDKNIIYSFLPLEEKVFYLMKMEIDKKLNIDLDLNPNLMNLNVKSNPQYYIKFKYEFALDNSDILWERSYVKLNTFIGSLYSICRMIFYLFKFIVFYISSGLFGYKFSKKIAIFKREKEQTKSNEINNEILKRNKEEIIHDLENIEQQIIKKERNNLRKFNDNKVDNERLQKNIEMVKLNKIDFNNDTPNDQIKFNLIKKDSKLSNFLTRKINKFDQKVFRIIDDNNTVNIDGDERNIEIFDENTRCNITKNINEENEEKITNSNTNFDSNRSRVNSITQNILKSEIKRNLIKSESLIPHESNNLRKKYIDEGIDYYDKNNTEIYEFSQIKNMAILEDEENDSHEDDNERRENMRNVHFSKNDPEKNEKKIDEKQINIDRKLLKKLKTINLDNSNIINLRIRKWFVVFKNFFFFCIKKNNDYKTLQITEKIKNYELDIVGISKKLIEYENMKSIMIESNKTELIKFLQKRVFLDKMGLKDLDNFYKNIFHIKTH